MSINGSEFNILEIKILFLNISIKQSTWSILSILFAFMKELSNIGGDKSSGSNVSVTSATLDDSSLTFSSHLSPLS